MTQVAEAQAPLVDFHCHVDLYADHERLIAESDELRIYTLAVTTTPKAWRRNQELAARSKFVRVALGLHPQLVAERSGELAMWKDLLREARYVGEVGLDAGPRFFRSLDQQKEIFASILRECARQGGKILSVHCVRSVAAVLDVVETHLPADGRRLVLHWFTGSRVEARRAVDLGCYFSINAEMLNSSRHRELVAALPVHRLLTETDGPFTKRDGHATRPRDVHASSASSPASAVPHVEMAARIASNLKDLVEVSGP